MNSHRLLAELQRRNVHRAAVFYAGAAWLLVQVATQVFPFFHIEEWVVRRVVIAAAIGFPFAMLFSWFYEWTPQGIKRESEIDHSQSITAQTGKRLDRWIIAVLGLAVVLLLANTFVLRKRTPADANQSIAVLPLLNESGDPSNEYFSDGLSEELIAALAQIGELKVVGRSSSFRFKDSAEDSKSIGEKLGVNTLLEGTVRKQGERLRIVAELVNAADGRELWSQTFDRELKDIFAVQAEIAKAVAASLKLTLLGGAAMPHAEGSTASVEAHNAYLQGHFLAERLNLQDYRTAAIHFDEATRLDPSYALAYAARSEVWTWIADWAQDNGGEAKAAARRDAEKAVAADPNLAEAHAALGWVRFFTDWKFAEGLAELRHAGQLAPNNATVNELLGRVLLYMGEMKEAEQVARRSIEIDPLTFKAHENMARILFAQGRIDEAEAEGRKAAELQPNAAASHRWQVFAAVFRRDGEAALREAKLEPAEGYRDFELALAQATRHDPAAADAALAELIRFGHDGLAYQIAQVYAWRDDTDTAFAWLQRAYDQHDTGLLSLPSDPFLRKLRGDARYQALQAKLGLPELAL
ncbi:MAG: hypothetical protein JWR16_2615 [Nevskia sp.]|nr:hypothetical protein [Nevskia sp.]